MTASPEIVGDRAEAGWSCAPRIGRSMRAFTRWRTTALVDQLELQRLKKQKLAMKDRIARLESDLLPDIIA